VVGSPTRDKTLHSFQTSALRKMCSWGEVAILVGVGVAVGTEAAAGVGVAVRIAVGTVVGSDLLSGKQATIRSDNPRTENNARTRMVAIVLSIEDNLDVLAFSPRCPSRGPRASSIPRGPNIVTPT